MDADLARIVDAASHSRMTWGLDDCGSFACNLAKATCGQDPRPDAIVGTYDSPLGLRRVLRSLGHATLLGYVTERMHDIGWPVTDASDPSALVGFVHMGHKGTTRAVMCGRIAPGWFAARGLHDVVFLPARNVKEAWACPS